MLTPGTALGTYEIIELLGKGGMGEVYQATDSKLGRSVAIKCLPDASANDAERGARFQREARVVASLNHSNIAAIYGLEETGGRHFLVMELVSGETLADRIARGPIPMDEALDIARQVTNALEAAHEKNILHRDLKPANIKITQDGKVKVLDFGLAKILGDEPVNSALSNSPTMISNASVPGTILGTAAYMSPEQSRGKPVDKRTDVWAFGIVLYEMLVGRRVFDGETVADVIGTIVHKEPDWESLPVETPVAIRRLLRRCLAKDARQRLHDIADARLEIETASNEPVVETRSQRSSNRAWLIAGIFVVAIAATAFVTRWWLTGVTSDETTLWSSILPPEKPFSRDVFPAPALSPDGRILAFHAPNAGGQKVIWVQALDSPAARALPGTEGSKELFWSPDGRSLGFFANSKLQRIDIAGGAPQVLADAPVGEGGTWASDGTILFVPAAVTVHRIPASGGTPVEVTHLNAARHELIHGWPSFLPDEKHFLLWVFSSEKQNEGVYVGTLDTGELRPILPLRTRAQYANGYLFFGRQGNLMAQRFDLGTLQLSGEASRVTEGLGLSCCETANMAFSVSRSGNIVWWGGPSPYAGKSQPTWFDRLGHNAGTLGEPGSYYGLIPSLDGKYAATESFDLRALTADILLLDLANGNPSRLTFVNYWAGNPVWSRDSQRVLFTQWRDHLDVATVQGGAVEQVPFPGGGNSDFPLGWSPDGQNLLLLRSTPETRRDLWVLPMSGDHKARPYLNSSINEFDGRISPDGHWVAYATDELGRNEVFVQSFPIAGNKKRISTSGGVLPMWRSDGRELYFMTSDRTLMAVSVTPGPIAVESSTPVRLFQLTGVYGEENFGFGRSPYAPSADGQRFLLLVPMEDDRPQGLHLIHHWKP
jgi:eukaryotic-like serine/threonine-protein kinase